MELIVECPLNSLSFGNVSYNILRELWKKDVRVGIFPISDNVDVSAYDKIDPKFKEWMQKALDNRYDFLDKKTSSLRIWHLNGSDFRRTPKQALYTFYETNKPTLIEKRIARFQDATIFSSRHALDCFKTESGDNFKSVGIGFDEDFGPTNRKYLQGVVHFGISGKFEKRKHTKEIIQLWLKEFGNNNKYQLTCCITNPFFKPEQMSHLLSDVTEGKNYNNINFLPYLNTNSEVNDFLNSIDIDLTGLSGAEGWNLPAFNATALGKWSIVLNNTSHKDWATKENCILLEPSGKEEVYDGVFFQRGADFNQGEISTFDKDEAVEAMKKAVDRAGETNEEGVKLKEQFTYGKTVDAILETINEL